MYKSSSHEQQCMLVNAKPRICLTGLSTIYPVAGRVDEALRLLP
jgi:hypothetical protein